MEEEVSTVEIDGVLYEKHEDREGVMDRRPHWDDDLIDAVRDAVDIEFDEVLRLTEDSILAIIAAVEDWQEREKIRCKSDRAYHCATHDTQWLDDESDRCEYKRMVDAEAKIKRVRELCDTATSATAAYNQPLNEYERRLGRPSIGLAVARVDVSAVLRALDGDLTQEHSADELTKLTKEMGLYDD